MKYDFIKEIQNKNLKVTPTRVTILKVLFSMKKPETVKDIYKKLNGIDLVTLYRTLNSFEKNGLIRRVDLHKDSVYYEINTEHHHHIICKKCGAVEDFKVCDIDNLTKQIISKASHFKNVSDHNLELFGTCNTCCK